MLPRKKERILLGRADRSLVANPDDIFERDLQDVCEKGIRTYVEKYEKCTYKFPGDKGNDCISRPAKLHRGHMSAEGQNRSGYFTGKRSWDGRSRKLWLTETRRRFVAYYRDLFIAEDGSSCAPDLLQRRIRIERERVYQRYCNFWSSMRSNKTCFACVQAVPDHVLACGHAYCPRCIQELGHPSSKFECAWDMLSCVLCWSSRQPNPHLVRLKPRCSGARVLTIDGGGIRGIVALSVLQAVEKQLDLDVPIRDMFDLVVGTSTGTCLENLSFIKHQG
jgi:hypothetical protein